MGAATPIKTVRHWLKVIAHGKKDCCYVNGIRLFLNEWDAKSHRKIERLCKQLKEVADDDEAFAVCAFGAGATSFFKGLDIEAIKW